MPYFKRGWSFFWKGWRHVWRQLFSLFSDYIFVALTIIGNGFVLVNAVVFYFLEKDVNPQLKSLLDAVWWSFATVTTVGYGDVVPITNLGKIHGILLMLAGVAIFLSFTALFARVVLGEDFADVQERMRALEKDVKRLEKEVHEKNK